MFSTVTPSSARCTRASAATLFTFCCASSVAVAGVLVGNPIVCTVDAAPGDSISSASGFLEAYELDDCDGKTHTVTVNESVDLLTGEEWTVPSDDWCTLTLRFDGGLTVSGFATGSYTETTADELVLDRASGSPDGFVLSDIGLSSASVRSSAFVE